MESDWLIVVVRVAPFLLWTVIAARARSIIGAIEKDPDIALRRVLIIYLVWAGTFILTLGSLVPIGLFPGDLARSVYTGYSVACLIVAITFLVTFRR